MEKGRITRVSGSVVTAAGLPSPGLNHRVSVGEESLAGEIIRIREEEATIQVYESTEGLRIGEPVSDSGTPFSVVLGPGLLGSIFDGIQRPLDRLRAAEGDFVGRGSALGFDQDERRWEVRLAVRPGDRVEGGATVAEVEESPVLTHRVLCPPGTAGVVRQVHEGKLGLGDAVCELEDGAKVMLGHAWPCRIARPHGGKLSSAAAHVTGQRVLDCFFPVARGGVAVIPGGFGTGKTILQHALAKHVDADVVVYVGCGERGNEMSDILRGFAELIDPRTGRPLMERTVLIVNTSNMPVAAREASIYTGITVAEYYRDMGHRVVMLADSLSRWAEALREISSRLEELPAEEGFPAYLSSRLSQFYERAGRVRRPGGAEGEGSLTTVAAVSPPGGDLSEPVTQVSLRTAGCFWALDPALAAQRHFPAVDWRASFSLYRPSLAAAWLKMGGEAWDEGVRGLEGLLAREESLAEVAALVGYDALQDSEKLAMVAGRAVREGFLRQDYFDPEDTFCSPSKCARMMRRFLEAYAEAQKVLEKGETPYEDVRELLDVGGLMRLRFSPSSREEGSA